VSPQQEGTLVTAVYNALQAKGLQGTTKILIYDHNWNNYYYPMQILASSAYSSLAGTAFHCYGGDVSQQSIVHNAYPQKEIHMTECTGGTWATNFGDNLIWNMQNLYMGAPLNWASSVMLWNIALDSQNGPTNHGCLTCRGVVTINNNTMRAEDVVLNVEYYVIAHLAKFVRPGAKRIQTNVSSNDGSVSAVAFVVEAKNQIVCVTLNQNGNTEQVEVHWNGSWFQFNLPQGVATFVWSTN